MNMIKFLSSKPEKFTGEIFYIGNNKWNFGLLN